MNNLPLNNVENTRDNLAHTIDNNNSDYSKQKFMTFKCQFLKYFFLSKSVHFIFIVKSPVKLSMTEKRVIGGLKQLTELLFKQHYKQQDSNQCHSTQSDEPLQSDEVTTSTEFEATSSDAQSDKENDERFQQYIDDGQGEHFCAMVVKQLTSKSSIDHSEEWHHGQLEAYNMAHKRLFEQVE